jgi:hypothetical protein
MSATRCLWTLVFVSLIARPAAADDNEIERRLFDRGYLMQAVITDDGRHVVTSAFRHARDRGGFRWGAWVTIHDLESEDSHGVGDGIGPVSLSPDQSRVAFARYTREQRAHSPNCIAMTIVNLEDMQSIQLSLPDSFRPVEIHQRAVLAICWNGDGEQLFALDSWGNLWNWRTSEPDAPPAVLDHLHFQMAMGYGGLPFHANTEFRSEADDSLHFHSSYGYEDSVTVDWQRNEEGTWTRTSETKHEGDGSARFRFDEMPREFQSLNGRYTLVDEVAVLTLTDTETGAVTPLPFFAEVVDPAE